MTGAEFLLWTIIVAGAGLAATYIFRDALASLCDWLDDRDARNRDDDEPLGG